jgi:hypothetical protein
MARSENPHMRHLQTYIAEAEGVDPWRKLAIAMWHRMAVDVRQGLCEATLDELCLMADVCGVNVARGKIKRLAGL